MDVFFSVLGWIGIGGFAGCHLLLSWKVLKVNTFYQCLQLGCAICLGTSAFWAGFYQSMGLEIFWAAISISAIIGYRKMVPTQVAAQT